MRIRQSTLLNISTERAWAAVSRPKLLNYVAWPVQVFQPIEPRAWPDTWQDGSYKVRLWMFGFIPLGTQWIVISHPRVVAGGYSLRDNGHGSLAKRWDHLITIEPVSKDQCRYTDEVEVEAGILTAAVALFALLFYQHRQRRWRKLVARGMRSMEQQH